MIKNIFNSLFLNPNLKVISLLILTFNAYGLNEYTSTKNTGKNKYQRIGTIEEYLTKLSQELPADFDKKIMELQSQIDKIAKDDNSPIEELKRQILGLKTELDKVKKENKDELNKNIELLTKKIEDDKKDNQLQIDTLRTSLDAKILVLEKFIANFGKVDIKK